MSSKYAAKQKGFTLVEALVTVIVIGVVGAIAIPSMSAIVRNQAISSTTNEIIATLQSARSEAIKRSTNVRVCFRQLTTGRQCRNVTDKTGNDYDANYIYAFIDADSDERRDNDEEQLFLSNELNQDIIFVLPSNDNLKITKSILFDSRGNALIDNGATKKTRGQIGICDDRNSNGVGRIIQITSTGRAQASKIPEGSTVSCVPTT